MSMGDSTREKFLAFHKEYPEVWWYFNKFATFALNRGHTRFSARAVMERVRWETLAGETPLVDDPRYKSTFKINNNFVPYYARLFMETHNLPDFFETREIKS